MSGFIDCRPSFSHIHPQVSASAVVTITAKMLKAVSGWRWLVADWCAAPLQEISDDRLQWPDYRLLTTGPGRAKGNKGETGCWPILPICTMLTTLLAYTAIYLYTIYTICLYLHRQPGLIEPRRTSELVELTRPGAKPLPRDLMPVSLICCKSSRKINHQSEQSEKVL